MDNHGSIISPYRVYQRCLMMICPAFSNPPFTTCLGGGGGMGVTYLRYNKSDKIQCFLPNVYFKVVTQEQLNIWIDLSESSRFCSNRSVIPIFQNSDIKWVQCGLILFKDIKNLSLNCRSSHTSKEFFIQLRLAICQGKI